MKSVFAILLGMILLGAFFLTRHLEVVPTAEEPVAKVLPSFQAPRARGPRAAVEPAREEANAVISEPTMAPGEENADPELVKKRAEEERELRELREQTATALSLRHGT